MRTLLICIFLIGRISYGDSFFVEEPTGTGIGAEDAIAVVQFVRTAVVEAQHTLSESREKADFTLRSKLMRLGKSYLFSLEKHRQDTLIFSTQMKATQIEELDDVVRRVTLAVLREVPANKDSQVDDVTEDEATRGTRRRPARRGSFLAFGPASLSSLNAAGLGFYLASAYAWDLNRVMVRLRAELTINGGALLSDFGLGASYFFSDRSIAPFVGMDVGFGAARIDRGSFFLNEGVSGFILAPLVGVHLLRTSAINLEIAGRVAFLLKRGSLGSPVAYTLRLGLYF